MFHECAVEIHELLTVLAPGARRSPGVSARNGVAAAAALAAAAHGRAAARDSDGDGRGVRRPACRDPAPAASPRRRSRSAGLGDCVRLRGRRRRREGALPAGQRRRRRQRSDDRLPRLHRRRRRPHRRDHRRDHARAAGPGVRGGPHGDARPRRGQAPGAAEGAVLRLGALVRTSVATTTGSGSAGAWYRRGATSNAWALLVSKVFGARSAGRTAAIVTENTPSGQYELTALSAGGHQREVAGRLRARPRSACPRHARLRRGRARRC